MAKHTPGPWSYDYGLLPPDGPSRYSQVTVDGGNHVICDVNEYLDGNANGYLIAAAPDLLKELYHLVNLIDSGLNKGTILIPGLATLNGAKEAIKKAEGKEA